MKSKAPSEEYTFDKLFVLRYMQKTRFGVFIAVSFPSGAEQDELDGAAPKAGNGDE